VVYGDELLDRVAQSPGCLQFFSSFAKGLRDKMPPECFAKASAAASDKVVRPSRNRSPLCVAKATAA
jgi:hypothetical protein